MWVKQKHYHRIQLNTQENGERKKRTRLTTKWKKKMRKLHTKFNFLYANKCTIPYALQTNKVQT